MWSKNSLMTSNGQFMVIFIQFLFSLSKTNASSRHGAGIHRRRDEIYQGFPTGAEADVIGSAIEYTTEEASHFMTVVNIYGHNRMPFRLLAGCGHPVEKFVGI
jgi:hypothetical protein